MLPSPRLRLIDVITNEEYLVVNRSHVNHREPCNELWWVLTTCIQLSERLDFTAVKFALLVTVCLKKASTDCITHSRVTNPVVVSVAPALILE